MLTENDVIDAVCDYLERHKYRVENKLTTSEKGVDIVVVHEETGAEFLIEAKGETSSKEGTKRFGKSFNSAQVKVHVAEAFFQAARVLPNGPSTSRRVAIALPDTSLHRNYVGEIRYAIERLGIEVLFVDENRIVKAL